LEEGAFILEFAMISKRGGFENLIIMFVKFPLFLGDCLMGIWPARWFVLVGMV
jgi:hypothetical protein